MKISVIGAGNVGSALAERILSNNLADVALVDIMGDMAKGKALDLMDSAPVMGYGKSIEGSDSYEIIKDSLAVVVTAGLPRKPGMSREDLISKNREIVKSVSKNVKKFSPGAFAIIVTNPLDIMTYIAYNELKCKRNRILGMAGNLDAARFKAILSENTGVLPKKIETFVLGSHGDTMVPLVSRTVIDGKPLSEVLDSEKIKNIVERTKKRGGEIVGLLKSGSAYFSPSAACFEILDTIINDKKKVISCACILDGEYGFNDCALGVPAKIGKDGVEEILEWKLPDDEKNAFKNSAKVARDILKNL